MADTHVLLAKSTVSSAGASSITFSNIPQTGYTDLLIKVSARSTRTGTDIDDELRLQFNENSTGYSTKMIEGSGNSGVRSTTDSGSYFGRGTLPTDNSTVNSFGNTEYYIPNYTSSNKKSISFDTVMETNQAYSIMLIVAGLWDNTSAITSIKLSAIGTFDQYSTFYLYGISKLNTSPTSAPKATGGDIITNDGTYWYHAFLSSGTFTPQVGLTANCLVVAGGGGGGDISAGNNGGGGAGGLLAFTNQSLTATSYTVTIGAGGAINTNGGNSQIGSLTAAVGGGYGGKAVNSAGGSDGGAGGSGGGGAVYNPSYAGNGGAGTAGQGNNGGTAILSPSYSGGGGGGANSVGANATSSGGGNGGTGSSIYSSWGSATTTGQNVSGTYYYAGGGGGSGGYGYASSTGGNGGGGNGASNTVVATAGTANTGGGGGGGNYVQGSYVGKAGGSGIVIIRYAM